MPLHLAITADTAFCLGFDVKKSAGTESGFVPASTDRGGALFADLRLEGFAAAIQTGFAKRLVALGGDEIRYRDEEQTINRAEAIEKMLVEDFRIDSKLVDSIPSRSNTKGDIEAIKTYIRLRQLDIECCCVLTSHYHGQRAAMDLWASNLRLPVYSAEAFLLLNAEVDNEDRVLISRFGGGSLAARDVNEIQGIADKIRGTFKSRTDYTPATR